MTTHGTLDDELDGEDVEDVPLASHIILSVNMIERGSEPIDEIKYLVTEFAARNKNKELVLNNYIELIAVLAFNDVSTTQARGKEFTMYQLMSTNVDGILSNYKMKAYCQYKVIIVKTRKLTLKDINLAVMNLFLLVTTILYTCYLKLLSQ
jgi:hypothetical protein